VVGYEVCSAPHTLLPAHQVKKILNFNKMNYNRMFGETINYHTV